jgi:hypothetical protein
MDLTFDQVKQFWLEKTGFGADQIDLDIYTAQHNYRAKSKYGTATVLVGNIKLRKQMELWLEDLYKELD